MMKAIVIDKHGGPEVLELKTITTPPQQEKVIVKVGYAGLNFIDIYQREGRYPGINLPLTLGIEAAGTVDYAPPGSGLSVGERVMFASAAQGAYAEYVAVPAESLLRVPAGITLAQAASALEHGLTADMLVHSVANIEQRTAAHDATALVHAAAGGVGRWLVRMLIDRGVRVIAVVSSAEKAIVVEQLGAIAVLQDGSNWQTAAMDTSSGVRPRWIFDSVGADTFEQSMDLLATRSAPLAVRFRRRQLQKSCPNRPPSRAQCFHTFYRRRPSRKCGRIECFKKYKATQPGYHRCTRLN
jgi:NADPH:quinone reductase